MRFILLQCLLRLFPLRNVLGNAIHPDNVLIYHNRQRGYAPLDAMARFMGNRNLAVLGFTAQNLIEGTQPPTNAICSGTVKLRNDVWSNSCA